MKREYVVEYSTDTHINSAFDVVVFVVLTVAALSLALYVL